MGLGEFIPDPVEKWVGKRVEDAGEADDRTVRYEHDAAGQRVARTTALGEHIAHEHDVLGRTVAKDAAGRTTTYTYDAVGNRTALTASGHPLEFDHDAAGRETTRRLSGTLSLTQIWDPAGHLTDQTLT
ncbi:hypothetical protein B7755_034370 [Streptomyces sp. NBS 14/10]|uniref:hypothetical protein n=1 Tax=Streptomyces sp. NBS 14/10 TaxID=1945643 RepID=UPI000B7F5201|nr:hypothetical protein [Streptomyces sp. NBS 14/10]KAK1182776.1 hypothetical protein B7755_034370 [Streptomyces sp. NBS 14/10]